MTVIDGFPFVFSPGGIKSYLKSFIIALSNEKINKNPKNFILLVPDLGLLDFDKDLIEELSKGSVEIKIINLNSYFIPINLLRIKTDTKRRLALFLWAQYFLPKEIKKIKPDIVFHPYQTVSNYKTTAKKITLIHDIFNWTYTDRYSRIEKYFYNTYKKGCINSDTIITISNYSKSEISKYLKINLDKIYVGFEGINEIYRNIEPDKEELKLTIENYALPNKYIFGFISARNYKNSLANVKLLSKLLKTNKNLKLILLGGDINLNQKVREYIYENRLSDHILFIPKVKSEIDLYYIYHLSEYFIFLSYGEGFGLPPLEALAAKTMPIVANTSALDEIYSEYLPTFHPDDIDNISEYIENLRPEDKEKIIKNARNKLLDKYSWKRVLNNYLNFIQ